MKAVYVYPIGAGPDKGVLTYFTAKEVSIGDTVEIKVRGRKVLAIVDGVDSLENDKSAIKKSSFKLKKIESVLGQTLHGGPLYKTAKILSNYYISHPGLILKALRPVIFNEPTIRDIHSPKIQSRANANIVIEKIQPQLIQLSKNDRIIFLKKLIREYFAKKKSIAIILPTIHEAHVWFELLAKGIAEHTLVFTGDESKKNQKEMVLRSAKSEHPLLLIGTFFATVLPVKNLGAIVVEHESSSLYESKYRPTIDRRLACEAYAHTLGIPLYYSDSLLSIKTSSRSRLKTASNVEKLNFRIHSKPPEIIDMATKKPGKNGFKSISTQSLELIKKSLDKNEQIFIFSLRKNYASNTVCRDCGLGVSCKTCGSALTLLSDSGRVFYCPKCDENQDTDIVCSRCHSWNLVPLGSGIDRIYEELVEAGLEKEVIKIDSRQKNIESLVNDFLNRKKNIILGTEAALNHLPEKIELSIIISLDSFFAMPLYTAPERASQLIMNISELSKKIIIQTRHKNEKVIEGADRGSFQDFVNTELETRSNLGYPPYKRLIGLSFSGQLSSIEKATKKLEEIFAEYKPEFFEQANQKNNITARMILRLEPDLWPLIPKNDSDSQDEDLFQKLSLLPKAIKIEVD